MNDAAKQLLLAQGQLQRSIIRAVDNLKKLGRANVTPATLRSRISTIKDNWARFFLDHSELLRLVDETTQATTPYFKNNVFDEVEDAYQAALDYMNESLESLEPPVVSLNHSGSDNASLLSRPNLALSHLPPISLPPFNGSLEQWEHFRDRFTALIIQNRELKDFARMHYLLSCLTGSALECVRELPVTAENFDVAWKALSTRFENKRRLIRGHLSTLLNLPSITKESANDLQGLIDKVSASLTALKNLNRRSRDLWHDMLVYIISQRLDNSTRKAWSMRISDSDTLPTTTELLDFLQSRQRALDDVVVTSSRPSGVKNVPHKVNVATASTRSVSAPAPDTAVAATPLRGRSAPSNVGSVSICPICQSRHFFSSCPSFVKGNSSQRRNLVQVHKRCFNCLSGNHGVRDCNSRFTCRKCHQRHHTMLHGENSAGSSSASPPEPSNSDAAAPPSQNAEITALVASRASPQRPTTVLLATAWISVSSSSGRQLRVRALIDQGSEMTFVSESVARLLKLKRIRFPISVAAVGGSNVGTYNFVGNISISPVDRQVPSIDRLAVIMPTLTSYAPRGNAGILSLPHLLNIQLADLNPASSKPIDVILGADIYNEIILDGLKKGAPTQPIAQNTIFGWIVSGPIDSRIGDAADQKEPLANVTVHLTVTHNSESLDLANALERFWQTEEPPAHRDSSREDNECEAHFVNTHARQTDGRYVVRIPFKTPPPIDIGSSKTKALSCLKSLLRRFQSNPAQAAEYRAFMTEYESLGHMRIATSSGSQEVFIPHHPVYRLDSATSRIRVVFNASSLTSNGSSLNEHMYSGPKLQSDLPTVILRWRLFRYVCTADIAKMYRQILVAESDIDYQRILWSPGSTDAIREYQLLTVTYGTACAPFLALRVLQQLSLDDGHNFPLARDILRDHIYVDDVLFGAHSVSLLVEKRDQLIELLNRGRFTLRKWASNSSKLLADINPADHGLACNPIPLLDEQLKILGIHWLPHSDEFRFRVSLDGSAPTTKREILSTIAKFYDPMGWGTPTIICAKILIQRLWKLKAAWDELVPPSILTRWQKIYSSLSQLNSLHVPRWIGVESDSASIELHGFADASSDAYAAVVYARVISSSGTVTTSLLVGKSKVAPLKLLSIPRLELSAAVLLAKLIEFVREILPKAISCTCWTDSSIVLAWLKQPPSHWKMFVANRVADIQNRLANVSWRHVVTKDNPADCASRGLLGSDLLNHPLWWHGPPWLKLSSEQWPNSIATVPPTAPLEHAQEILRVGGRIRHLLLSFDEKHPMILPKNSHMTGLIIASCHSKVLHGEVQQTLGLLRSQFWLPGQTSVKRHIYGCLQCVRWWAQAPHQIMADLPSA
ncbi:uncharacterized protein [Cardiocondyla obscurior]|uniref:uncharacterized protein n=1 Tax=Cardiocondyla obscurior TaxID=286306 RepID=UPI0039655A90